jgi:hypothetical protein
MPALAHFAGAGLPWLMVISIVGAIVAHLRTCAMRNDVSAIVMI